MANIPELKLLRKTVKANQSAIIKGIKDEFYNLNGKRQPFCMFCGTNQNLTREHVLPRWTFEHCDKRIFITSINGVKQTYNRTTIPACVNCNRALLNALEMSIIKTFSKFEVKENTHNLTNEELENIIRWFETIDYKFQVTGFTRQFIKSENIPWSQYLSKIPIALYRTDLANDREILAELRFTLKRLGIKSKAVHINSLVIFKSKNTSFHFFHSYNKFLYIELPGYQIGLLYFFNEIFETQVEGYKAAMKLIKEVY